ncbi:molybdenum hydroxylase [Clostridium sulfidigenes]|uniref:Molybdenum hydroxylase n=1 Tax=Clostridium sulfidigenes TaxID=318464 RepID=A0A084JAB0_9CLOT|nr:molybdenum hydroxylase [Clostridium sulfidigenes]
MKQGDDLVINNRIIVRGGGDIASGTIQKLHRSGFKVLVLEIEIPSSIRRNVSFSEAVFDGETTIEGMKGVLVRTYDEILEAWDMGYIPVAVDRYGKLIETVRPIAVVDAILAKKNLGTTIDMAPITIALGPGFKAGIDVNVVVETMRGHSLGRLIFDGYALEDTGVPGSICGYAKERVIYSSYEGKIKNIRQIGDIVKANETIALIDDLEVKAKIDGVLRGIIRDNTYITKGLKIADVDPRHDEISNCNTISDKSRTIGGSVLEGILYFQSIKPFLSVAN